MKNRVLLKSLRAALIATAVSASVLAYSQSTGQTAPGAGNQTAQKIAAASEMAQSAYRFIIAQSQQLSDPHLLAQTYEALANPQTCLAHRANLNAAQRQTIVNNLLAAGLLNPADDASFPGGLINGVFPPVLNDN